MIKTIIMMGCLCVSLIAGITSVTDLTNSEIYGNSVIVHKDVKSGGSFSLAIPQNISTRQLDILKTAYTIAREDGNPHPEKFQAIILTESNACDGIKYKVAGQEFNGKNRYYGCGQVMLVAAKAVLNKNPELWKYMQTKEDDEVVANLILNDEFNLKIASKYFMMQNGGKADNLAVTSYNQGAGGAKLVDPNTWHYTKVVNANVKSAAVKYANLM